MKDSLKILFVALVFLKSGDCVADFKKIILTDPDALCLDGTKGAYYVHEGPENKKWLLNFEGGGWCGSSVGLA